MNVETDEVQGSGKNVGKSVMEVPRLNTKIRYWEYYYLLKVKTGKSFINYTS